ncbi:hypothetical protein JAAARDRAFT_42821 [Jaapia argillacea MUCL 33604]|uniref:Uncharacterized protein n=1 Tax=Jaapia argillacea MUCL 33604 TaxID=933084 RepID=A0A067P6S2_9AGAM|nr:hypothetical protein JAAARDRAFT_42821 [Jaapia argillacea MUCL 33604]
MAELHDDRKDSNDVGDDDKPTRVSLVARVTENCPRYLISRSIFGKIRDRRPSPHVHGKNWSQAMLTEIYFPPGLCLYKATSTCSPCLLPGAECNIPDHRCPIIAAVKFSWQGDNPIRRLQISLVACSVQHRHHACFHTSTRATRNTPPYPPDASCAMNKSPTSLVKPYPGKGGIALIRSTITLSSRTTLKSMILEVDVAVR